MPGRHHTHENKKGKNGKNLAETEEKTQLNGKQNPEVSIKIIMVLGMCALAVKSANR